MKILVRLFAQTLAIVVTAWLVPGFMVDSWVAAVSAAVVVSFLNLFIKPILLLLTLPLTLLTFGLFSFAVSVGLLWLAAEVTPGFTLMDGWSAIIGALVLSVVSMVFERLGKS